MSSSMAVGVAVSATFVLLIVGLIILVCVLANRSPRKRQGMANTVKKGTQNIKKKAVQLKEEKSRDGCCACLPCCRKNRIEGPVPDPPFGVELSDPTSSEITILWNEPTTGQGAVPILGYNVYKRFKSNYETLTKVGKVTGDQLEYRIKGLVANRMYIFGVSTRGSNGESNIVDSQTITLKKDPVTPGAPTEFEATTQTSSTITLCWKPPRKDGYARIERYYIMIKDLDSKSDWYHLTKLQAFDRFMDFKVTGLKPNHQYRFRVNAENSAGLGPYAETVNVETSDIEPVPPEKPNGPIKYGKTSPSSVTLSWQPPEQDGGKPLSGYAIEYKEKNEKGWHKAGVCDASHTKFTVTSLQEDTTYIFRIVAINVIGNSKALVGGKIRTKLLEIPLSRRSSVILASRGSSRGLPAGRNIGSSLGERPLRDLEAGAISKNNNTVITNTDETNALRNKLENLDLQLEADPFVPKSDFFTYNETDYPGSLSHRHGDNKTRHSHLSPLPAPPPESDLIGKTKKRSENSEIPEKRRHSVYSPLPRPKSFRDHSRLTQRGESDTESGDNQEHEENEDANHRENDTNGFANTKTGQQSQNNDIQDTMNQTNIINGVYASRDVIRHQPTPSNIAYKHSRF